jgi:uncharacterized membrane protein
MASNDTDPGDQDGRGRPGDPGNQDGRGHSRDPGDQDGRGRVGVRRWLGPGLIVRAGNLEFERVLFFSDAIFAIAITLLVIDLRVPASGTVQADHVLRAAVPQMIGFGIGFGVIGLFWLGHHSLCRFLTAIDGPALRLNLLFLGAIAFLPYPTALLSDTSGQVAAVVFFAVCAGGAGLAEAVFWLYVLRVPGMVGPGLSAERQRVVTLRTLRVPLVFLVSVPVAFASHTAAEYLWLMLLVLGLVINRFAVGGEGSHSRAEAPAR